MRLLKIVCATSALLLSASLITVPAMAQTQPAPALSIADLCAGKLPPAVADMPPETQAAMRAQAAAICAVAQRSAKPQDIAK